MESDLATAGEELERVRDEAKQVQDGLASQIESLQTEKESLAADLAKAQNEAEKAKAWEDARERQMVVLKSSLTGMRQELKQHVRQEHAELQAREPDLPLDVDGSQPDIKEQIISLQPPPRETSAASVEDKTAAFVEEITEQPQKKTDIQEETQEAPAPVVESEVHTLSEVSDEEVSNAVFSGGATERIAFNRALSDLTNRDGAVRVDAIKSMSVIDHELSVRALIVHLARESDPRVRQECVKTLTTLEMKEALPAVRKALADPAPSVRLAAVWASYQLAGPQDAPLLAEMLSDEDEGVRRRAATCIGWLGQADLAEVLLPLLNDESDSVRRSAAEAMGNLRNRQTLFALIEHLNDPVESVGKIVLAAIEKITGKKMSKSLPKGEAQLQRLIVRWSEWWKSEQAAEERCVAQK